MKSPEAVPFTGDSAETSPKGVFNIFCTAKCVDGKIVALAPVNDVTVLSQQINDQQVLFAQTGPAAK